MERRRFGQHVDALAECAFADLVVVLDEPDEGGRRQVAAGLAALLAAAVARRFALIHEASRERFAEPLDRTLGIVGVVAAGIAGRQMLVDVVDVDIPLRVVKSGCPPIPDQHRGLVAIVFQYEVNVTAGLRTEEHTSELQSLMRSSYAVFCLKKKNHESDVTRT